MPLRKTTSILAIGGLLACGAAAGWMTPKLLPTSAAVQTADPATSVAANPSTPNGPIPLGTAPDYRAIVAQNRAAVVGVNTEGQMRVSEQDSDDSPGDESSGNDPFFKFFRGLPGPRARTPVHGLGSGFIVTPDGIILTNAHVVRDASHVTVKLADRREFRAKVLGIDTATDVAVLKIDAHQLPTVRVTNSDELAVGDYVLAIGAPYGLEESATAGIVSAKGRSLPGDSSVPFIQTDVAVNPGNSGGPLFDAHGAVVGINSQIYSTTGGYQGVSFAIPIDVVLRVESQLVKSGKVEHARLGVIVQPVDQSLAGSFKLAAPAGALVSKVEPASAAARAGIQVGDIILNYNGKPVDDAGSLSAQVGMAQPGDAVTLNVWREGKPLELSAHLGSAASEGASLASASGSEHGKLGLSVRPLNPDELSQAGVAGGLVVEEASGPAASAGIQPGDVVLSIDGTPVKNVEQMRSAVNGHKDTVALLIQRGATRIFIPVALG